MSWRVVIERRAEREIEALDRPMRERVLKALARLAQDPFAAQGVKALSGSEFYRLRVGDYRVIYRLRGNELLILVLRVAHRREAYRAP